MHDPMDESQLWKHEQCSTARISHKLTVNIHNKPYRHSYVQSVYTHYTHTYIHTHDPKHNINIRFHTRLFKQIIKPHTYIKKNKYILIQIHAATQQQEEPYATIKLREARCAKKRTK